MAYTTGDLITTSEYNTFVNSAVSPYGYNHFAGTGSGAYGLGQSTISTVSVGNTVTAAQFNSLFTGMTNIANHTNRSLTSASAVATGDTIAVRAALISDIAGLAADVAAGCPNATALTNSASKTADTTSSWTTSQTVTTTWTAASADALRFFFNQGGKIVISWSRTTGEAHAKNNEWTDIAARAGTLTLKAHDLDVTGSGTVNLDYGYHDLTGSYQTLYTTVGDTSPYTANTIQFQASYSGAVLSVRTVFTDGAADTTYNSATVTDNDYVGTMRMTSYARNPNTNEGLATAYTVS